MHLIPCCCRSVAAISGIRSRCCLGASTVSSVVRGVAIEGVRACFSDPQPNPGYEADR
jgi:hypothetical protein